MHNYLVMNRLIYRGYQIIGHGLYPHQNNPDTALIVWTILGQFINVSFPISVFSKVILDIIFDAHLLCLWFFVSRFLFAFRLFILFWFLFSSGFLLTGRFIPTFMSSLNTIEDLFPFLDCTRKIFRRRTSTDHIGHFFSDINKQIE